MILVWLGKFDVHFFAQTYGCFLLYNRSQDIAYCKFFPFL